jgi:hypothetical protein
VRSAIDKKIQHKQKRQGKEYHHEFHLLLGAFPVLGKKVFFRIVGQVQSPSSGFYCLWLRGFEQSHCIARLRGNQTGPRHSTSSLYSWIPAQQALRDRRCGIIAPILQAHF